MATSLSLMAGSGQQPFSHECPALNRIPHPYFVFSEKRPHFDNPLGEGIVSKDMSPRVFSNPLGVSVRGDSPPPGEDYGVGFQTRVILPTCCHVSKNRFASSLTCFSPSLAAPTSIRTVRDLSHRREGLPIHGYYHRQLHPCRGRGRGVHGGPNHWKTWTGSRDCAGGIFRVPAHCVRPHGCIRRRT